MVRGKLCHSARRQNREERKMTMTEKPENNGIPIAAPEDIPLARREDCSPEVNQKRLDLERDWGKAYQCSSDEALLDYLWRCGAVLGHSPATWEVLGYVYLKKRFGPWPRILEMAGVKEKSLKRVTKEAGIQTKYQERREKRQKKKSLPEP